jgi:hypothetical protein
MGFSGKRCEEILEFGNLMFLDREGYLAMLGAYIDESGAPESTPTFVLSAFYTTPKEWKKIVREWEGIVQRYGVTAFHATDCANGAGEFKGWSDERRKAMFRNLINILSSHKNLQGCSAGLVIQDYKSIVHKEADDLFGGPRTLAFQLLVLEVAKRAQMPVAFIMDKPPKGWGKVSEVFAKTKLEPRLWCSYLHSLTPGDVRTFPAIQTSDLLAYETYRELNKKTKNEPHRRVRKSLWRLLIEKSLTGPYLDKESLARLIEECRKSGKLKPS